jgi:hypothetical protein
MQDADFSDEFCAFIQKTIPAVDAAEILLVLYEQPDAWWHPGEVARKLQPAASISDAEAARYLEIFHTRGLLAMDLDRGYQYRPASEILAAHVRTLAQAYNERPVTLIRMIYALRDLKIQSFADAFKLRRK